MVQGGPGGGAPALVLEPVTAFLVPLFFGVSVLMTVVTTLMAPILLVPLFRSRASGLKA